MLRTQSPSKSISVILTVLHYGLWIPKYCISSSVKCNRWDCGIFPHNYYDVIDSFRAVLLFELSTYYVDSSL